MRLRISFLWFETFLIHEKITMIWMELKNIPMSVYYLYCPLSSRVIKITRTNGLWNTGQTFASDSTVPVFQKKKQSSNYEVLHDYPMQYIHLYCVELLICQGKVLGLSLRLAQPWGLTTRRRQFGRKVWLRIATSDRSRQLAEIS